MAKKLKGSDTMDAVVEAIKEAGTELVLTKKGDSYILSLTPVVEGEPLENGVQVTPDFVANIEGVDQPANIQLEKIFNGEVGHVANFPFDAPVETLVGVVEYMLGITHSTPAE